MTSLTTGKLVQEAGVAVQTVRFYERRGYANRPTRSVNAQSGNLLEKTGDG